MSTLEPTSCQRRSGVAASRFTMSFSRSATSGIAREDADLHNRAGRAPAGTGPAPSHAPGRQAPRHLADRLRPAQSFGNALYQVQATSVATRLAYDRLHLA